jgi:EpsI family protein
VNKRILILSVAILLFAIFVNFYSFHEVIPLKKPLHDLPVKWMGWTGKDFYFDDIIMDKLNVSDYIMREYRRGNNMVALYVGYYASQKKGAQIHSPKQCLPGGGRFKISERKRTINIAGEKDASFIEAVYQKGDTLEVYYYWYKMKNAYITNEYVLKVYMILNSLRYRRNDAAFLRLSTSINDNKEEAVNSVDAFMQDFLPIFKEYLPE